MYYLWNNWSTFIPHYDNMKGDSLFPIEIIINLIDDFYADNINTAGKFYRTWELVWDPRFFPERVSIPFLGWMTLQLNKHAPHVKPGLNGPSLLFFQTAPCENWENCISVLIHIKEE